MKKSKRSNKIQLMFILFCYAFFGLLLVNTLNSNAIPYLNAYRDYAFLIFGLIYIMLGGVILHKFMKLIYP